MKDIILNKFKLMGQELEKFIASGEEIKIGSLGPEGTTTYEATKYFIKYIESKGIQTKIQVCLWNNFSDIHKALVDKVVDLIIIPNPFENITQIYWDKKVDLAFGYVLESPLYGLAVKDETVLKKKHLKVATGPAVNHLIFELGNEILKEHTYELYRVNSTTEAAMAVFDGKADIAMTNQTSVERVKVKFITELLQAQIIWSVFKRK